MQKFMSQISCFKFCTKVTLKYKVSHGIEHIHLTAAKIFRILQNIMRLVEAQENVNNGINF